MKSYAPIAKALGSQLSDNFINNLLKSEKFTRSLCDKCHKVSRYHWKVFPRNLKHYIDITLNLSIYSLTELKTKWRSAIQDLGPK